MPPPAISDPWLASRKFGIVIDAGSSGSRLQVYSWKDARTVRLAEPEVALHTLPTVEKGTKSADEWQYKAEPGISTFGANPSGVAKYLAPLIAHAKDQIPPSLHRETPIFLLATAGMRLLPEKEQQNVLTAACEYIFQHSKFQLDSSNYDPQASAGLTRCGRSIRIISGEEEGLFGWIAVNYLLNGFALNHRDHQKPMTFGFLDMGGASTQTAFEPIPDRAGISNPASDGLIDVRLRLLNGEEIRHQIFVTTWLGFGTNQARERYLVSAASNAGTESTDIERNDNVKHSNSADASLEIVDPCLPKNLRQQKTSPTPATLVGTGSFTECLAQTSFLLNKAAPCNHPPCLFDGIHVPLIDFRHHRFIGVSEYWYSSQHIFGLGGAFDFEKYEKAADAFCSRDWNDILKQHQDNASPGSTSTWSKGVDLARLEMQCFKAAWIVNVLGEGIGIPRTSKAWKDIDAEKTEVKVDEKKVEELALGEGHIPNPIFQSLDTIKGTAISWTLGKMVLEASKGVPATSKNAPPLADPMGPSKATAKAGSRLPFGWTWDTIEEKFPVRLQTHTFGFSPILLVLYVVALLVIVWLGSRFRKQVRRAFRRWRRGASKREDDSFVNEDPSLMPSRSSNNLSRPQSPILSSEAHPRASMAMFAQIKSNLLRWLPLGANRRTSLKLANGMSRPRPRHSNSVPIPPSPSWMSASFVTIGNDAPTKLTSAVDDDLDSTTLPGPPTGLQSNRSLTALSLSRNSSQINLVRTEPTPRTPSGFNALTPISGYRTPSIYDDDV